MLHIINAKYQNDYKIELEFSDHKQGVVDLEDFILSGTIKPFVQLQDKEQFKSFEVDYTLKWQNDLDLAPEYLYFKTFEHDKTLQEQFREWGYKEQNEAI